MLPELVEAYYNPNMGLVTHLQYPVQREEEAEEEQGQFARRPTLKKTKTNKEIKI